MNKTKVNYWVDLVIALAFILSAVSGIIFLFPLNGATALGVSYIVWNQIHTWGSLLMVTGVLAHLVLHWKWIAAMTKKTFFAPAKPARPAAAANGSLVSRRQFLRAAGLGAVALGTTAVTYKSLFGSEAAAEDVVAQPMAAGTAVDNLPAPQVYDFTNGSAAQATAIPQTVVEPTAVPVQQTIVEPTATSIPVTVVPSQSANTQMTVACHKGITYDPYPGKCRHYVDNDGDGYCDLSIPTAS
jgi:hypothetical protein